MYRVAGVIPGYSENLTWTHNAISKRQHVNNTHLGIIIEVSRAKYTLFTADGNYSDKCQIAFLNSAK